MVHFCICRFNACLYSAFDKEKIRKNIKDMENIRREMLNEASIQRKHELDVARESSNRKN